MPIVLIIINNDNDICTVCKYIELYLTRFSNDIVFGTPDVDGIDIYLSVVVDRSSVGQGELFLNDVDIAGENPLSGPRGMSSVTTFLLPDTSYRLATTPQLKDDVRFAAYVYGFGNHIGFSYLAALSGE